MTKLNFTESLEFLDSLKQMYYLCQAVHEYASPVRPVSYKIERSLISLGDMSFDEALATLERDARFIDCQYTKGKMVDPSSPLGAEFQRILDRAEECDQGFYTRFGYGKYWNEVALPQFVGKLFSKLAAEMKKDWPLLIGSSDMVGKGDMRNGMYAISYYDMSDEILIFKNREAAEAFADQNGVDPSDYMEYWDGAWFCQ